MNRVEEILSKHLADHAINGNVTDGVAEITLEFTKWKDDNYHLIKSVVSEAYVSKTSKVLLQGNDWYYEDLILNKGKTIEQLFNEWNNLNNK